MSHQIAINFFELTITLIAFVGLQAGGALACSSNYAINSLEQSAPVTTVFKPNPPRILGPETNTVPPRYSGLSLFQVYLILRKRFPEKSQYETTNVYQARLNYNKTFGLIYGYSSEHYIPFVQKVNSFSEKKFNTDTNELTIEINGIAGSSILNTTPRVFIDFMMLSEGNYVGSNIYGNRVVVDRVMSCSTSLSLNSIRQPIVEGLNGLVINIPMSPQVAQQVRDDLSIIFLAKLTPPFHGYSRSYTKPTITQPRESGDDEFTVHGDMGGVIIFQTSTGRILFNGT